MPRRKRPVLGVDYVIDPDGSAQFTRTYLLGRSECCEHECRYCPYIDPITKSQVMEEQPAGATQQMSTAASH